MSEGAYVLAGAADPGGRGLGFVIPVFRLQGANRLFVQRVAGGRVSGFEAVDVRGRDLLDVDPETVSVGAAARWAFALGRDDVIVGTDRRGRSVLKKRLDRTPLDDMPALAFEVAEFLGLRERRAELAARTYKRISARSEVAGRSWRDLSVLTPDLRAAVAARLGAVVGADLVAGVRGSSVSISMTHPGDADGINAVRSAANEVMRELTPLYGGKGAGWIVEIATAPPPSADPGQPDAVVYVPTPALEGLLREIHGSGTLRLECYLQQHIAEFAVAVQSRGVPGFVIGEAADDRLQANAADAHLDLVVISLAGPADMVRLEPGAPGSVRTIMVEAPAPSRGRPVRTPSSAGPVLQAMAAALAVDASGGELPPRSIMLRAKGGGPDPDTDAWLAIQDRAWSLGLDVHHAWRVGPTIRRGEGGRDLEPGWAARGFYGRNDVLHGEASNRALVSLRTGALALVPVQEPDAMADTRRRIAIEHMLDLQDWRLEGRGTSRTGTGRVSGARWRFTLDHRRSDAAGWSLNELLDRRLRDIDILAITPDANPGSILAALAAHGRLAVSARDLVRLPAERATLHTVLGNQLRRLGSHAPSRARSHFLALLVGDAFAHGDVDRPARNQLHGLIREPLFGQRLLLTSRRTRTTLDTVETELRVAVREGSGRPRDVGGPEDGFRLIVHDNGVAILAGENGHR